MLELKYRLDRISELVKTNSAAVDPNSSYLRNLYIGVTSVAALLTIITIANVVFLYTNNEQYYAAAININNWGNFLGFLSLNLLMVCSYTMLMRAIELH